MRRCGGILWLVGVTVFVVGTIAGIALLATAPSDYFAHAGNLGFFLIIGSVIGGLIIYSIGGILVTVDVIMTDIHAKPTRSASWHKITQEMGRYRQHPRRSLNHNASHSDRAITVAISRRRPKQQAAASRYRR